MPVDRLGIDIDTPSGRQTLATLYKRLGPDALSAAGMIMLGHMQPPPLPVMNDLRHPADRLSNAAFDCSD